MTTRGQASVFSSLDPGEAFISDVEQQTELYRQQKAARLTARAKQIGKQRLREHRDSGTVARSASGGVRGVHSFDSLWHLQRAKGACDQFDRIRACGKTEGYSVQLTCRGCADKQVIPVGCSSVTFCAGCRTKEISRQRLALRTRFEGLIGAADRGGLMDRKRMHRPGGRFDLSFWTFTAPHVGLPGERIDKLYRAWKLFARALRAERDRRLPDDLTDVWLATKDGELKQQSLRDFFQLQRVTEWTPGDPKAPDYFGHPHFHVLLFSPYFDHARMTEMWTQAYNDANHTNHEKLIVHVTPVKNADGEHWRIGDWRESLRSVIQEVCKYLVKDWELQGGRVSPEVMASVFMAFDGRRKRQATAGLGLFAIVIVKACRKCQHESERGRHWAHVKVTHSLTEALNGPRLPWAQGPPIPPPAHEDERSTYEWATLRAEQRAHELWLATLEGRSFVERLRAEVDF